MIETKDHQLRDYDNCALQRVRESYKKQHEGMTVTFVRKKREEWLGLDRGTFTIKEMLDKLDSLVDESDPDVDIPNSIHAFQTAEKIRKERPEPDWFALVGLIHDLGKVLALWGEPQWCVVGDTFPVGCCFDKANIYHELFQQNHDNTDPRYRSKLGIYKENCGLENVLMAWGHDEYMYHVLKMSGSTIPEEGLSIIRYHSFYPWHTSGAYAHLASDYDQEVLKPWVQEFNKFDLYSKADQPLSSVDCEKLWENIYEPLCEKYGLVGLLNW